MKIDANDPRWTAYALGELEDERDRTEIEKVLGQSTEARDLVEEIRRTAGLLASELHDEPAVGLSEAQQDRIISRMDKGNRWFVLRPSWALASALSATAALVLLLVAGRQLLHEEPRLVSPHPQLETFLPPPPPPPAEDGGSPAVVSMESKPAEEDIPLRYQRSPTAKSEPEVGKTRIHTKIAAAESTLAQTAMLQGIVKDGSGNALSGVALKATSSQSGKSMEAVSNQVGHFAFPTLPAGNYTLTAELSGFKQAKVTGLFLETNTTRNANLTMEIGDIAETIEVTADAASIITQVAALDRVETKSQTPSATIDIMPKGVLQGTVTDITGGVIPGATIEAMNQVTKASSTAVSSDSGRYVFPALQPGSYSLEANLPGFARFRAQEIQITADDIKTENIRLSIGSVSETVEISNAASYIEAEAQPSLKGTGITRIPFGIAVRKLEADKILNEPMPAELEGIEFNTEAYAHLSDNPFLEVVQNPLSTFSIDVDTAAYSNMRRFLNSGSLPPKDAVRIEELINYFDYDYDGPVDEKPFSAHMAVTEAPWNPEHRLLRIGLKGREFESEQRPFSNLVFLIDVSGSMRPANKLPLLRQSLQLLADQLGKNDKVAMVVYAGASGLALPSTNGSEKKKIREALEKLEAGGSTNGASGILLAYQTAEANFIKDGINRVILATDGDFNVGITSHGELTRLIEEKAKSGVFLTALGFGMGNYKDTTLETLADKGNGNYAYIDTLNEARKVLVEEIHSTLVTIAKDVKIQIEFNPQLIAGYRLIGYENRLLHKEDFNDDTKDAGEIGAGHTVTALYELVPAGKPVPASGVDPLKYQQPMPPTDEATRRELLTLKIRHKNPDEDTSILSQYALTDSHHEFSEATADFKFAAAVAAFGMVLRDSPHKGNSTLEKALEWAKEGQGADPHGYRAEFIRLIHRAISIPR